MLSEVDVTRNKTRLQVVEIVSMEGVKRDTYIRALHSWMA